MNRVISSYKTALDELNLLVAASYYTAGGSKAERARKVSDDLLSFLVNAYVLGTNAASEMLGYNLATDIEKMQAAVFSRIDGKTFEDRAAEHIFSGNAGRLRTLAESEFHRVFNAAELDGAQAFQTDTGQAVVKNWRTMLDERVRDTHNYLEGMSAALNDDFYTWDNDHAPCPGGFEKVENNAGCRCWLTFQRDGMQGSPA